MNSGSSDTYRDTGPYSAAHRCDANMTDVANASATNADATATTTGERVS